MPVTTPVGTSTRPARNPTASSSPASADQRTSRLSQGCSTPSSTSTSARSAVALFIADHQSRETEKDRHPNTPADQSPATHRRRADAGWPDVSDLRTPETAWRPAAHPATSTIKAPRCTWNRYLSAPSDDSGDYRGVNCGLEHVPEPMNPKGAVLAPPDLATTRTVTEAWRTAGTTHIQFVLHKCCCEPYSTPDLESLVYTDPSVHTNELGRS
jgi:hypothetical protein